MRLAFPLWGLAAQMPLSPSIPSPQGFALNDNPDRFSPKDLVELERPSAAVPNVAGDLAFVTLSKYSFEDKKNHKSLVVLPLQSTFTSAEIPVRASPTHVQLDTHLSARWQLTNGGEVFWLTGTTLAHVVEGPNDNLEIYTRDCWGSYSVATADKGPLQIASEGTYIGSIPSKTATNFKYNPLSRHLVFSDHVYPDGNLETVKEQDEAWDNRGNSAYVYDETYVRHWDTWVGPKEPALFSVLLQLNPDRAWKMGSIFHAPLKGTNHHSPVEPFGGTDDFDVSAKHIVYTAKDPQLPEAWHTKQNVYIVDIMGHTRPRELTSGKQGATHNPVFNKQGTKVAWIELDEDGYESDRAKIVIYDLGADVRYTLTQHWDRSVESIKFNPEGDFIYFTAADHARTKIYYLPVPPTPSHSTTHPHFDKLYTEPFELTSIGSASSLYLLHPGRLLFTRSTLTSPNDAFLIQHLPRYLSDFLNPSGGDLQQVTGFTQAALAPKGLSPGEDFYFHGAHGKKIHGWALKPRGWKEGQKKKYPVVLLIHGGPQGAWEDAWSTRWNFNAFTGQGYFVIAINPTGSTSFGQELTDAIKEDWGGKPFEDLIRGWKYALEKYPEINPDRAVAAGASWGGYAINWIQGHPEFGFGFKALVCHDGVFDSAYNGFSTDELFFFNHEWGGRPWDRKSKKLSNEYSPSNFVHKWSTPQLLIHGSKDYRLPETDGIGAFHALQELGVPSRLVIFPDENHWVLNHGNSLKWHYEVFRWFDQFVGDHLYPEDAQEE
ncbi:Dipeptidyl-peptidase 5 [Leucoagaricus sp. SymC.cos]|nr:Dipeptidyl-peptidase 5 [Leucoagaricus sp. SymC.cos]